MKKQMKLFVPCMLFFIFSVVEINIANAQQQKEKQQVPKAVQAGQKENILEDTWELVEMDGEEVADLFPGKHPTIEFKVKEKQVAGFSGCNQYHGQLILDEEYLKIVGVVATKMACPALDNEEEFLAILQEVEQYSITGNELSLWSGGQLLLKFKKAD